MEEQVILVNNRDEESGLAGKMEAHKKGLLHRAFSVFIFNTQGEMLLQQRSLHKYHSGGLWTNTCCSHPRPDEETAHGARRRLREELGFSVALEKVFDFIYKADFDNGLTEHEFDHVYVGEYEGAIEFNKDEVMDICYRSMQEISDSLISHPQKFTPWFRLAFPRIENWWIKQYKNKPA